MLKRLLFSGVLFTAFALPVWSAAQEPEAETPSLLTFKKETHFTGSDGSDLTVTAGAYSINVGDRHRLWLTSETSKETLELSAEEMTHDLEVGDDVALLIAGEEERTHLVVLFQDKSGLAVVGFPSAARPRGTGLIRVNPSVLRQSAKVFAKPSPISSGPQTPPAAPGGNNRKKTAATIPGPLTLGQPRWITWSYLRMNNPQGVARILSEVQTGKLPPTTLNGLAQPAALTEMMKTNWAAEAARLDALQPRPAAPGNQAPLSGSGIRPRGLAGSGGSSFSRIASSPRFTEAPLPLQQAMRPVAVDQTVVNFGAMFYGQVRRRQIDLTAFKDGEITVSAPPNAAIRIISFESYTGGVRPLMHQTTGSGSLATMTAPAELVPEVDKKRTAAPFRLPVRAGQGMSVLMEFAPKKELGVAEGPYQATIQIDSTLFDKGQPVPDKISVAARAQINGLLFGADANPVTGNSSVLPDREFLIEFEFSNEGQPSEAVLEVSNMPLGFSSNVPALRMPLAKSERKRAGFMMKASATARGPGGSPEEKWITFKFTNGPNTFTLDYPVYLYPSWVQYPFRAEARTAENRLLFTQGTLDLRGDGWFCFQGYLAQTFLDLHQDGDFVVGFTLNNGGFKREVNYYNTDSPGPFNAQGMVREVEQEFIKTIEAGFRINLSGYGHCSGLGCL